MSERAPLQRGVFGLITFATLAILLAAYLGLFPGGLSFGSRTEDKVVSVPRDDAEMNAAIEKARATLPAFWTKFGTPGSNENGFALKLAIKDGENVEHMWCGTVTGTADKAQCTIDNAPETVKTVKLGQVMVVDPALISDWMYLRDGKIVGGKTIRVLVAHMSEAEAAGYRAMLADE